MGPWHVPPEWHPADKYHLYDAHGIPGSRAPVAIVTTGLPVVASSTSLAVDTVLATNV